MVFTGTCFGCLRAIIRDVKYLLRYPVKKINECYSIESFFVTLAAYRANRT